MAIEGSTDLLTFVQLQAFMHQINICLLQKQFEIINYITIVTYLNTNISSLELTTYLHKVKLYFFCNLNNL